jgi:hypothetical protein
MVLIGLIKQPVNLRLGAGFCVNESTYIKTVLVLILCTRFTNKYTGHPTAIVVDPCK